MAAARLPLTLGLPHTLSVSLIAAALLFFLIYNTGNQVNDAVAECDALDDFGQLVLIFGPANQLSIATGSSSPDWERPAH